MKKLIYILPLLLLFTACQEEIKVPKMVMIKNITILDFPMTDPNGISWDKYDAADILLIFIQNESYYIPEQYYIDLAPNKLPLNYEFAYGNLFYNLTDKVNIGLLDYDEGETSQLISSLEFNFQNHLNESSINLNQNNTNLIIYLEWFY